MGTPKTATPGVCRSCGCTDDEACEGGCFWVDVECTLCSRCAPATKKRDEEKAAAAGRWRKAGVGVQILDEGEDLDG